MSDDVSNIVQELRDRDDISQAEGGGPDTLSAKAADAIERLNAQALDLCAEISGLRRENERLRGLLRNAVANCDVTGYEGAAAWAAQRDAALAGAAIQPSAWRATVMPCGCIYRGTLTTSCPYHPVTAAPTDGAP
jgi:hypothetical protein